MGDGAFLYPGTVPGEDVPPYGILRGNPGQLTDFRFSQEEIRRLLTIRWWDFGTGLVNEIPAKERADMLHVLEKMEELSDCLLLQEIPSFPFSTENIRPLFTEKKKTGDSFAAVSGDDL